MWINTKMLAFSPDAHVSQFLRLSVTILIFLNNHFGLIVSWHFSPAFWWQINMDNWDYVGKIKQGVVFSSKRGVTFFRVRRELMGHFNEKVQIYIYSKVLRGSEFFHARSGIWVCFMCIMGGGWNVLHSWPNFHGPPAVVLEGCSLLKPTKICQITQL